MSILLYFKALFFRLIDALFGRTSVFITILGWFLLITGIWMLLRPEKARKSMSGRSFGFAKGYVLLSILFLGTLLFSINKKLGGIISFNILLVAIIFLARAYFILKKKVARNINVWVEKVPLKFLRIYAIVQIVVAAAMLLMRKRILF